MRPHPIVTAPRHLPDAEGEAIPAPDELPPDEVSARLIDAADQGENAYARERGWAPRRNGSNDRFPTDEAGRL